MTDTRRRIHLNEREHSYVPDCAHLGERAGELPCSRCRHPVPLHACHLHGECLPLGRTPAVGRPKYRHCEGCPDRADPPESLKPEGVTRVDLPGLAFNPSVVDHDGRLLMAYRDAHGGSRVWMTELDRDTLQPRAASKNIVLDHDRCRFGREDPRLFVHQGSLHVQFAGVQGHSWSEGVNVLYARLGRDRRVDRLWHPTFPGVGKLEKNWGPFVHEGDLWAVYKPGPGAHAVLHLWGEGVAERRETYWRPRWGGGDMRGGAPPVRVDGEYWSFFHGWERQGAGYRYTVGCYTFAAEPPFAPTRVTPFPILHTDEPHVEPGRGDVRVVFPGGAVRMGDDWLVACGHRDAECLMVRYSHDKLQKAMTKV